jgi:hypothetical protein
VRAGCGAGDVVESVAEGGELALGGGIVVGVEDRVRRLYRGDGVLPRFGEVCGEPEAVGYLLVGKAFAEAVDGEVGGEFRAAVPDGVAGAVGVAGCGKAVADDVAALGAEARLDLDAEGLR